MADHQDQTVTLNLTRDEAEALIYAIDVTEGESLDELHPEMRLVRGRLRELLG